MHELTIYTIAGFILTTVNLVAFGIHMVTYVESLMSKHDARKKAFGKLIIAEDISDGTRSIYLSPKYEYDELKDGEFVSFEIKRHTQK